MLNARLSEPLPGFIPRLGSNDPTVSTQLIESEMALFRKAQASS